MPGIDAFPDTAQVVDLQAAVGSGQVAASSVLARLRPPEGPKREVITGRPTAEAKLSITAGGVDDVFLRRSKCPISNRPSRS